MGHEEEWEDRDPGLASSSVGVRQQDVGPLRPRRYRRGDKVNRGYTSAGLSTKRTKAEVDTITEQKGRTTSLPDDFVTGYYPEDDFDFVRRDVKNFSENPLNSLGGGVQVSLGNSYPSGGDVHGHRENNCLL